MALDQNLSGDQELEPGEGGAEAGVRPLAEGQMGAQPGAAGPERVGVPAPPLRVAVGGGDDGDHPLPGPDRRVREHAVAGRGAHLPQRGRIEAQRLLDRVRQPFGPPVVLAQEPQHQIAQRETEVGHPGDDQEVQEGDGLLPLHLPQDARQGGPVGGPARPPLERRPLGARPLPQQIGEGGGPAVVLRRVRVIHPAEGGEYGTGERRGERGDEVSARLQPVRQHRGPLPHHGLQRLHHPAPEGGGEEAAQPGVGGRIQLGQGQMPLLGDGGVVPPTGPHLRIRQHRPYVRVAHDHVPAGQRSGDGQFAAQGGQARIRVVGVAQVEGVEEGNGAGHSPSRRTAAARSGAVTGSGAGRRTSSG